SPAPETSLRGAMEPSDTIAVRLKASAEAPALAQALSQAPKPDAKPSLKPALSTTDKAKSRKKNPDAIWLVQVGAFKQETLAKDWLKDIGKRFRNQLAEAEAKIIKGDGWYRARYVGLTQSEAKETCQAMSAKRLDCVVLKS
ncbi:MAG: SPOR domain-containing protein, partial [Asticcacaulis sp.]